MTVSNDMLERLAEAVFDDSVYSDQESNSADASIESLELDQTAALLAAGFAEVDREEPPASLRARVTNAIANADAPPPLSLESRAASQAHPDPRQNDQPTGRVPWLTASGWMAAAAAIVFAVSAMQFSGNQATTPEQTPSDLLASLEAAPDVQSRDWGAWQPVLDGDVGDALPYASDVSGRVVWSQERQAGVMILTNLPINDASAEQYQLWIVDGSQEQPVDGGVFDVASDGTVIIPIDPKLRIDNPAGFGITVERPGGVVVSDRTRRVVAALL